jgi:Na+/proline symporter
MDCWAWLVFFLLSLSSLILFFFPRFLVFITDAPQSKREIQRLSPLESFLCTQLGLALFTLALACLFLMPSDPPLKPVSNSQTLQHPLLILITIFASISSFIAYNTPSSQLGGLGYLVSGMTGGIALYGAWLSLFKNRPKRRRAGNKSK